MPRIPAALNLNANRASVASILDKEPVEGRRSITQVISWADPLARNLNAVSMNLQNNAVANFSQICGLIVDNSDCGCDLDFVFPDTDVVVSIPAYAPYTVLQVLTNQTQFFVVANGILTAGDITRFSVLNFAPDPVAVPLTVLQQTASSGSLTVDGVSTTPIIASPTNGTLQGINVTVACPLPSTSSNTLFTLQDGDLRVICRGNFALQNTSPGFNIALANLTGLNRRFTNGIFLLQAGGVTTGATVDINLYYKTP